MRAASFKGDLLMATCTRVRLLSLGLLAAAAGTWLLADPSHAQLVAQIVPAPPVAPVVPGAPGTAAPLPAIHTATPAMAEFLTSAFTSPAGALYAALRLVELLLPLSGALLLAKAYGQRKDGRSAAYVNFAVGTWLLLIGVGVLALDPSRPVAPVAVTSATAPGTVQPLIPPMYSVGCGGF